MIQNFTEPRLMTYSQLEAEVYSLRSNLDTTCKELTDSRRENKTQKIQIDALQRTNHIAGDLLKTISASIPESKREWLQKNVLRMCQDIKDIICEITEISVDNLCQSINDMYKCSMKICNFIYDHFSTIMVFSGLALGAALILFDVVILGAMVFGTSMSVEAASLAGLSPIFIDFALANSLVGS